MDREAGLPATVTAETRVQAASRLVPLAAKFFTNVDSCVNPAESAWLLAAEDFSRTDDFRWDEYDRMFLESADEEQAQEVRAFWDSYLPNFHLCRGRL